MNWQGAAGVTTEDALLDPNNRVHPDMYASALPELLEVKSELAPAS